MITILVNICVLRLPKLLPDAWTKSSFHMPKWMLIMLTIACTLTGLFNVVVLASTMSVGLLIGNIVIFACVLLYIRIRTKSGKVHMEVSYEEE